MDRNEDRKMTVEDAKAQLRFAARQADPANLLKFFKQNEVLVVAGAIVAGALIGYMLKPSGKPSTRTSKSHGGGTGGGELRQRDPGKMALLGAYVMQNIQQMLDEEMPQIKAALKDQFAQAVPQWKDQFMNKMSVRASRGSTSDDRTGSEYTTSATGAPETASSAGSTSAL